MWEIYNHVLLICNSRYISTKEIYNFHDIHS